MINKIKKILKFIRKPDIAIDENTALGDIGYDSLDQLEAVIELEDKFDVNLPDDIFSNVKTVKDLTNEIENIRNSN